jgi:hypothetical protein
MKRSNTVGCIAALALGLIAAPLAAQTSVEAAVVVQSGPNVEDRSVRVPGRDREVIVIERVRARGAWWKRPGYRTITVYYGGGRFYRRPFARAALRRVVVYERAGRYFLADDQWQRYHQDVRDHDDKDHDDYDRDDKDHGRHEHRGHWDGR